MKRKMNEASETCETLSDIPVHTVHTHRRWGEREEPGKIWGKNSLDLSKLLNKHHFTHPGSSMNSK